MKTRYALAALTLVLAAPGARAELEKPDTTYKIFQFPAGQIPRIDGDASDWAMVPDSYIVGTDQLVDDTNKHTGPAPQSLDVKVKVGWVAGENRLYFLYDAFDDYWDFALPGLKQDTFEIVVDGDLSGGPLISERHPHKALMGTPDEAFLQMQSVHAQNYHTFSPAVGKEWTMFWGAPQWLKHLPYANCAYKYDFKPREPGRLVMEFFITPFDFAALEGPARSAVSKLAENKIIGLCWAIIDYDDEAKSGNNGFWNLSPKHTMYGQADELVKFKLMPMEPELAPAINAAWSHMVIDPVARKVAFSDRSTSTGAIKSWKWDFGDKQTSTEQNPIHQYESPGRKVVVLEIEGEKGTSRLSKVWDVVLR